MRDIALSDHAFLSDLEEGHLEVVSTCVVGRSSWKPGELILLRGGDADVCHLLFDGTVAIEIRSPGTAPRTIQTLHSGDVLGWSWLFEPRLWTFDARAVSETTALTLDTTLLREAIDAHPEFGIQFITRMAKAIVTRLKATRLQVLDVYNR